MMKKFLLTLSLCIISTYAAAFSFTDIKGKQQNLSDYTGKWVLVNYWAPWCPRCKMDFPNLNDIDSLPNFVVIGIGMDYGTDKASIIDIAKRYNLRFPVIIGGTRRDIQFQVGPVDFYPTSYLFDPSGKLIMFIPGVVNKQRLMRLSK